MTNNIEIFSIKDYYLQFYISYRPNMPRPLRIEFEDAWYHVMNRGAGYQPIYKTNKHRYLFLEILTQASELFGIEIHGYCLMDNHYHLLIKTPRANLSRAMRHINGVYTQRYNRSIKKDGSLFRGRYKAIIVEKNDYLLQVSRYIHLNPVAANIINSPHDYDWSSYRSYLEPTLRSNWLKTDEILSMFKNTNAYKQFVEEGLDQETENFYKKTNMSVIFGTITFKEKLLTPLPEEKKKVSITDYHYTREVPPTIQIEQAIANYFNVDLNTLYKSTSHQKNTPRRIAIYGCRMWNAEKLSSLAQRYGSVSHSNISNIVSSIKKRIDIDEKLAQAISHIRTTLSLKKPE